MASEKTKQDLHQLFENAFQQFETNLNGEKELAVHDIRTEAYETFKRSGFPSRKNEEYKYTSITSRLESKIENVDLQQPSYDHKAVKLPFTLEGNILTFINGNYISSQSKFLSKEDEIDVTDLKEAFRSKWHILDHHFSKYANPEKDSFIAINTALAYDGSFIHIKENVILEEPIIILNYIDSSQQDLTVNTRNLILADKNSQAEIIELTISESGHFSFENRVSEIILMDNASITHYNVQQEGENDYLVDNTQVYQDTNSRFTNFTITLHGSLIRNNLGVTIDGEGCETNLYGVFFLDGNDHVDNHTEVDHRKPHSNSNELYKGILDDKSTGVFNGKIYVQQAAQKTNAFQSNKNIILTNDASMNTKPQLEIWADDVKCSHGATTGMIEEEKLFYLQSRGIDKVTARAMLLYAFANDVLDKIHIDPLKIYLETQIQQRLGKEF